MAKDEVVPNFSLGRQWVQPFWDEFSHSAVSGGGRVQWPDTQLALFGDFYFYKGANSNEDWVISVHRDYGSTNIEDEFKCVM